MSNGSTFGINRRVFIYPDNLHCCCCQWDLRNVDISVRELLTQEWREPTAESWWPSRPAKMRLGDFLDNSRGRVD